MEQAKINLYRLLLFTLGVVFVLALLPKCYGSSSEITNNSNKDTIKIYKVKIDSIEVIRTKYINKYKTLRDTINIHDTIEVIHALNLCDTIIKTDSNQIAYFKTLVNNYEKVIYNDSLVIDSLKTSKKKYFKGFKHGFVTGVLVTGVASLIILK